MASELDLQRMERILAEHPDATIGTIYSPFVLLIWRDQFNTARIKYFEKSSPEDMKQAETILNSSEIVFRDMNILFPYSQMIWEE